MRVQRWFIGMTAAAVVVLAGCTSTSGQATPTSPPASVPHSAAMMTSPPVAASVVTAASSDVAASGSDAVISRSPLPVSDTLKTGMGDISGVTAYLSATEQTWRGTIAGLSTDAAKVGTDARCYFVLDSNQVFTSTIACGPVRRTNAADGHVWDLYTTQVTNFDSTPTLLTAEPGATGSAAPTGTLYRPDGQTPAATDGSLPAPAKPPADPALLATLDLSGLPTSSAVTVDPAKNTVISPAGTVQLTQVATLGSLDGSTDLSLISGADLDSTKTYGPAAHHHFQVFTLTTTPGWPKADTALTDSSAPNGTVTFIDGNEHTDISDQAGLNSYSSSTTVSFIASVLDGSTPKISVGVAGHQQSMSIQTATRDRDPLTDAYYKPNRQVAVNASSPTYTKTYGQYSNQYSYTLTVSTVTFTPYDPTKGWAPAGHMWVEVVATDDASDSEAELTPNYSGWTLTAAKKVYRASANTLRATSSSGLATFLVPNTITSVTGSLTTKVAAQSVFDATQMQTFQGPPAVFHASLS